MLSSHSVIIVIILLSEQHDYGYDDGYDYYETRKPTRLRQKHLSLPVHTRAAPERRVINTRESEPVQAVSQVTAPQPVIFPQQLQPQTLQPQQLQAPAVMQAPLQVPALPAPVQAPVPVLPAPIPEVPVAQYHEQVCHN